MIEYKTGDLLEGGCGIICHQVNLQGVMGGGLALQIANTYPNAKKVYEKYCYMGVQSLGEVVFAVEPNTIIANCFSQKENFDTCYASVEKCFRMVKKIAMCKKCTVGIPYGYGCGIANGEWGKVEAIIEKVFANSKVVCKIYKL